MAMKKSSLTDFYNLLNLAEDYLVTGHRRAHPLLPDPVPDPTPWPSHDPPDRTASTAVKEPSASDLSSLDVIAREVVDCSRCRLHEGRTHAVPGEGAPSPVVMVIGEGPGAEEDRTGRPFVGPAGRYLDEWLSAVTIGPEATPLSRETNVFIANVVKCRPPGNRDPLPDESAACMGYLSRQIEYLTPRAILTVGRVATQTVLGSTVGIGALRGRIYRYGAIPLVPTYHPSAVLRDRSLRRPVWEDLKLLRTAIDDA